MKRRASSSRAAGSPRAGEGRDSARSETVTGIPLRGGADGWSSNDKRTPIASGLVSHEASPPAALSPGLASSPLAFLQGSGEIDFAIAPSSFDGSTYAEGFNRFERSRQSFSSLSTKNSKQ